MLEINKRDMTSRSWPICRQLVACQFNRPTYCVQCANSRARRSRVYAARVRVRHLSLLAQSLLVYSDDLPGRSREDFCRNEVVSNFLGSSSPKWASFVHATLED